MTTTNQAFTVKVGEFEGPLMVLLNLIEERRLHISQVSLAAVTDSFIEYMHRLDPEHKAEVADFIVVAATLMLIKSVSLLPTLELSAEEKTDMADLERRLKIYQEIKSVMGEVASRFGRQPIYFSYHEPERTPLFTPTPALTLPTLLEAVKRVIAALPAVDLLPQVVLKKILSLEEVIGSLTDRLKRALSLSFKDFVADKKDKVNVIVSFLGVLELVKQGLVKAEQANRFADIALETSEPGLPHY